MEPVDLFEYVKNRQYVNWCLILFVVYVHAGIAMAISVADVWDKVGLWFAIGCGISIIGILIGLVICVNKSDAFERGLKDQRFAVDM